MADISILSRLINGYQRNVDLSANALVVGSIKIGSSSPVEITKAIATKLIAINAAADADGTYDTRYNTKAQLAATTAANGASLIGVQDAGNHYTATTVEGVLAEIYPQLGSAAATGITYNNATSGLAATNVQSAIDEVEGRVDATEIVANAAIPLAQKGANNGVATLDAGGKVPVSQLPNSIMEYKGTYDANTNSPSLSNGTGNTGDVYRVTVAGSRNFGAGAILFEVGDYAIYNGTVYEKADTTDSVSSVNGQQGAVVLTTTNIAEGTNLYFTDERAMDAVGAALVDTATIDFTYTDGSDQITADVKDNSITANKLTTNVADQSTITGGNGSSLVVQYAPKNQKTVIAGESLAADVTFAVRLALTGETAGRYYKADIDASVSNKFFAIGLARSFAGASAGGIVPLIFGGTHTLGANDTPFASGDIGKPVYLSTSGALTLTAPSAVDSAVMRVGIVETTTTIFVGPQLHGIN